MKSKIFISILLCLFATSMQAQDVAEWLQTARTAFENGEYRTVLTNVAKIEDAVGSATKPATAYLRIMSHYRLREYEKCVSAANAYLGAKPAQDETLTEIRTALADAKEQVQLAEEKQRKQAAFAQEAAAEWEKLKTSDSKTALQTFAGKYAGTAQEKLARQRYDELVKQETEAEALSKRIAKAKATLEEEMLKVEGGTFKLTKKEQVAVNDFYISKYEITVELWELVTGEKCEKLSQYAGNCKYRQIEYSDDGPYFSNENFYNENLPAYFSQKNILKFIEKLNEMTGKHYRLPTETEWLYAAHGGKQSKKYKYSGSNKWKDVAQFSENSQEHVDFKKKTEPSLFLYDNYYIVLMQSVHAPWKPNELGIESMSGGVWELCTTGSANSEYILRGGGYKDYPMKIDEARKAVGDYCGFRLVLDAE